jgi:UDP-glucose 4-epimerase
MARYLVTGANGFVGGALTGALLARGDEVWAFDLVIGPSLRAQGERYRGLHLVPGEMTEWPQLLTTLRASRADAVVHCAAVVGVVAAAAAPLATMRVNIAGALNLLEAMQITGTRRMVNISTEEVYGHFMSDLITEDHPCRPLMPYGISKFAVEQLARGYSSRFELECLHLRTCWVYGPGLPRPRVPKNLIDAAVAGRPLHLPHGAGFRVDHVYIDDLVSGVLAALDKPNHRFDCYHIASGTAPPLEELIAIIRELVPTADISAGRGPMCMADGVELVRKGALDIARAGAELGYQPRYDVRAGLMACVAAALADSP